MHLGAEITAKIKVNFWLWHHEVLEDSSFHNWKRKKRAKTEWPFGQAARTLARLECSASLKWQRS